jgi:hypothetical protein
MKVGKLTTEQKDLLIGKEFSVDSFFNPIQDLNNNWVISKQEMDSKKFDWLKDLEIIEYEIKPFIEFQDEPNIETIIEEEVIKNDFIDVDNL